MVNLLKNGKIALAAALISLFMIYVLSWAWLGIIIYLIAFIASIFVLVQEFKEKGLGIASFIVLKVKDVFSKNILNKGAHFIVVCLVPLALYFFYYDLTVDRVIKSMNELQESIGDWLDY